MIVIAGVLVIAVLAAGCAGDDDGGSGSSQPPRGGLIAFASSRDGDFDVYVMDLQGASVTNLTRNASSASTEADDKDPEWSPDGAWIAFTSTRDHEGDGLADDEIYVMRADGSDQRRLTSDELPDFAPRWLDSRRVAFVHCAGALTTCRLVARTIDGGPEETVAGAAPEVWGSRSPDGTRVAFIGPLPTDWFAHTPGDVYLAEAGGSRPVRLTETPDAYEAAVSWSPDGERIAFVSDRDHNGACLFHDCVGYAREIYVMRADGSDQRRLTDFAGDDGFPTWSADGEQILFGRIASEQDDWELYVMNADGSCLTRLTDNEAWDWTPAWSGGRDGRRSC